MEIQCTVGTQIQHGKAHNWPDMLHSLEKVQPISFSLPACHGVVVYTEYSCCILISNIAERLVEGHSKTMYKISAQMPFFKQCNKTPLFEIFNFNHSQKQNKTEKKKNKQLKTQRNKRDFKRDDILSAMLKRPDLQYNFIAKCQYNCTRNVLWCQVHSSHIHGNHKTLNYINSEHQRTSNIRVKSDSQINR